MIGKVSCNPLIFKADEENKNNKKHSKSNECFYFVFFLLYFLSEFKLLYIIKINVFF